MCCLTSAAHSSDPERKLGDLEELCSKTEFRFRRQGFKECDRPGHKASPLNAHLPVVYSNWNKFHRPQYVRPEQLLFQIRNEQSKKTESESNTKYIGNLLNSYNRVRELFVHRYGIRFKSDQGLLSRKQKCKIEEITGWILCLNQISSQHAPVAQLD
jgi:hypothetical protein